MAGDATGGPKTAPYFFETRSLDFVSLLRDFAQDDELVGDGGRISAMSKGKLIVIDGTDGSGKATQTAMLARRLKREGRTVRTISFPRHGHPSGYMVDRYLAGKFGSADEVGPYRGSLLYAVDRYAASFQIREWLDRGYVVVADRYVSANMGHQTGKISGAKARVVFLDWLDNLEFKIFGIPRPDLTLLLYVPPVVSRKLVRGRGRKQDIHEKDRRHIRRAAGAFLAVAKRYRWPVIHCAPGGEMLTVPEVHGLVWARVRGVVGRGR